MIKMIMIFILLVLIKNKKLKNDFAIQDISFMDHVQYCEFETTNRERTDFEKTCDDQNVDPVCGFRIECHNIRDKSCYQTFPNVCEACKRSKFFKKKRCDFYKSNNNFSKTYCEKSDRNQPCTFCNSNMPDIGEKCTHRAVCGRVNHSMKLNKEWEQFKNGCNACARTYITYYENQECFDLMY